MKKTAKKVSILLLAGMMAFGCTACNMGKSGMGGDADDVKLIVQLADLGHGTMWVQDFNKRFIEQYKDKDYGNGHKGVYVDIDTSQNTHSAGTMSTEGTQIYLYSNQAKKMAANGTLLALDEIVNEKYDNGRSIAEKIPAGIIEQTKGTDGKFYTIPTYETYVGVFYDVELFDKYGYYFADPRPGVVDEGNCYEFASTLLSNVNNYADVSFASGSTGKFFFVDSENSDWETHKSVGPDGVANTLDDGLPSTIYEFIVLCERMQEEGVQPVQMPGQYPHYVNQLMNAVLAQLQGPEKMETTYTMEGTIDVVTGFSDENLVGTIDYLKKPITKTIEITEESGYYTTWQVERYYAEALVEILETQPGFFADGSREVGGVSHLGAQENFIYSGYNRLGQTSPEIGMFTDGSHWWNESRTRNTLNNFYKMNTNCQERKVAFMPMPSNIANRVTGEDKIKTTNGITESVKGHPLTLSQPGSGGGGYCCYVNKKVANDSSVYEAVKDWIQFFFSDAELSNTTASSGFMMRLNYEVEQDDYNKLVYFEKNMYQTAKSAYIYRGLGCMSAQENPTLYNRDYNSGYFTCCGRSSIVECFRAKNSHSTMEGFEKQIITMKKWSEYYHGQYPEDISAVDNTVFVKKYS
ncbi:MAG: hypothetical protein E7364_01050 [Clostridiales bacterium]|nr:hypothetical protein [Clostridiales bacterium]